MREWLSRGDRMRRRDDRVAEQRRQTRRKDDRVAEQRRQDEERR